MSTPILPPALERFEIHAAVCRARRAGLACSTCSDLHERLERAHERISRVVTAATSLAEVP